MAAGRVVSSYHSRSVAGVGAEEPAVAGVEVVAGEVEGEAAAASEDSEVLAAVAVLAAAVRAVTGDQRSVSWRR